MIIRRKLIRKHYDDDDSPEGWVVKQHFKWADPSFSGRTLTHDILEHRKFDTGTFTEEIAAFGRIWAYRGDSPSLYPNVYGEAKAYKVGEELWNAIIMPIMDRKNRFYLTCPTKPFKRLTEEEKLLTIIADNAVPHDLNDYNYLNEATRDEVYAYVLQWLVYGYRDAMKIINTLGYHPGDLWATVEREISNALKYGSRELKIYIDTDRCYCEILAEKNERLFS